MKRIFYSVIIILFAKSVFAYSHIHPVPSLPKDINPFTIFDVFSESVVAKIHCTLFRMDNNNSVPQLIDDFNVSKDQLVYTFRLKDMKFHDGRRLTFEDVQYSLESVIRRKPPGYEKLSSILGFADFAAGRTPHVSGLAKGDTSAEFKIILQRPSPLLVNNLVEFRFSIVPSDGNYYIGLGQYKIRTFSSSDVTLELVDRKSRPLAPEYITYKQLNLGDAIESFLKGQADDLFAYPMGRDDIHAFRGKANIQEIRVPRTYLFALSARSFPLQSHRSYILSLIDKSGLINACYKGNIPTQSAIPPGFMGYISEIREKSSSNSMSPFHGVMRLRIDVAKGVGNEQCVVDKFKEYFSPLGKIEIRVVDTAVGISNWNTKRSDAFFAHFESENTFDFFQMFNPHANFTLGVPGDKEIIHLMEGYNSDPLPSSRHTRALEISRHIAELSVAEPIFHPKQYLIYSRRYKPIQGNAQSVTFIPFDKFALDANHIEVTK